MLTKLGNSNSQTDRKLETFENTAQNLKIVLRCMEFTCRCPVTHQPDWATIDIAYLPGKHIVESKSVKLYLETFREVGIFHEHLAQQILDDFVSALSPVECSVIVHFNVRGGIAIDATATYNHVHT